MSRTGKKPIPVPEGVNVTVSGQEITIENSGKKVFRRIPDGLAAKLEDKQLFLLRSDDSRRQKSLHGLTRTLIHNTVSGIKEPFKKRLELQGRGKRAKVKGKSLVLELGFSHPVNFEIPEDIEVNIDKDIIEVSGIDKQKVGEVAAEIRIIDPPEPYKGTGIRYEGERVRKKAGKAAIGGGFTGTGK
jgi:large subunit ribosomal protein L6